jgi:hypothetical protein
MRGDALRPAPPCRQQPPALALAAAPTRPPPSLLHSSCPQKISKGDKGSFFIATRAADVETAPFLEPPPPRAPKQQ